MNLMFWKKKPAAADDDEAANAAVHAKPHGEETTADAPEITASRSKKILLVSAVMALTVLSLVLVGLAAKRIFSPSESPATDVPASDATPQPVLPTLHGDKKLISLPAIELQKIEPRAMEPGQAGIEALKNKNVELQTQLDELKKQQAQAQSTPAASAPAQPAVRKAQSSTADGDVVLGSKNPKSNAMSIKEAIAEMNAITDKDAKKAAPKSASKKDKP